MIDRLYAFGIAGAICLAVGVGIGWALRAPQLALATAAKTNALTAKDKAESSAKAVKAELAAYRIKAEEKAKEAKAIADENFRVTNDVYSALAKDRAKRDARLLAAATADNKRLRELTAAADRSSLSSPTADPRERYEADRDRLLRQFGERLLLVRAEAKGNADTGLDCQRAITQINKVRATRLSSITEEQ